VNINTLLNEGYPNDDGSVQIFIDTLSWNALAQHLSDAIEEVEFDNPNPDYILC
jgi:hypothetical protein